MSSVYKSSVSFSKKFILISLNVGFMLASLMGCAGPGEYIRDSNVSLTDTRRSLVKIFGEPRHLSQNGREFTTSFFDKKGRMIGSVKKAKERRYAHITILGERRPYDVLVHVIVERQVEDGSYEDTDDDDALAENLIKQIQVELLKSLENRNIIDDFNAI